MLKTTIALNKKDYKIIDKYVKKYNLIKTNKFILGQYLFLLQWLDGLYTQKSLIIYHKLNLKIIIFLL